MKIRIIIVAYYCFPVQSFFVTQGNTATRMKTELFAQKKKGIKAEMEDFDVSGGRPGTIIESEEELARKDEIFEELTDGTREMPEWTSEYEDVIIGAGQYDIDDPDAIDATTLGVWNVHDLKAKFDYELDPEEGDPDPNELDPSFRYVEENPVDEDGVEIGYDPMRGSSHPIDERTIVGTSDSYMIADDTRDDSLLTPIFHPGDVEEPLNKEIEKFRKSLDIIETYTDPFLGPDVEVPRNVAKWHGLPQRLSYPEKDFTNNRFTKEEDMTDFDALSPYVARKTAVQYARAKNAEWLPEGVSAEYHAKQRAPYEKVGTLMGTLREGEKDPAIVDLIQPALKVLGSIVDLLSIEADGKIFRFYYHGLIKNKYGMSCWAQTLIRDCGIECDNVVFETGFRKRDPQYDGGDPWYGPY
eukprot:CAMPEP_0194224688 /NCGR_PEP_ID=MMETSP0156-20130528/37995_1 /TAXON_ID=33649 /ORGANISM="Thalassionema nitzschioides, Strain L26-B" /LENGTH=412 /DNA_ID=CAMNT_0038956363 /DNA_START=138 /DNA_END=1376 /DNA_ORIENTATION=-